MELRGRVAQRLAPGERVEEPPLVGGQARTYLSYACAAFPCQTETWLIFLDTTTTSFTATIPATICSTPDVCPTLIAGDFASGRLRPWRPPASPMQSSRPGARGGAP
jgi:hypothetical protein